MSFILLLIGISGLAGAVELGTSPVVAIVVTVIGFVLFAKDYKKYLDEQNRG